MHNAAGCWLHIVTDELLEFHVRLVPDGRVTGYIANELKVGDNVRVSGPMGTAYLRRTYTGPMLCVAGGTGLAVFAQDRSSVTCP